MALEYQKNDESAVVEGLPRVVELITILPAEKRLTALMAAQQSCLQIARTLGYREIEAQQWAATVISILENQLSRLDPAQRRLGQQERAASLGRAVPLPSKDRPPVFRAVTSH
jgi:hypothetical protein